MKKKAQEYRHLNTAMDSFNYTQASIMLAEYGNWYRDQDDKVDLLYPRNSIIARKVKGVEHEMPENENIKLVAKALDHQPFLKKVAICKYVACKKCNIQARADFLSSSGIEVGKKPSTRQNNVKIFEMQLESYVQGFIANLDGE